MSELKRGDYVEFVKGRHAGKIGQLLEDPNPNPNFDPEDEIWAEADVEGRSVEIESADEVRASDWVPPTPDQIADVISSSLHHGFDNDLRVHTTEPDGRVVYTEADWKGVPVNFEISVIFVAVGQP